MPIFPKRALVAIATTAVALVLMFSFRTPETAITHSPSGAIVAPVGQGPASSPRPTGRGGGSGVGSGSGSGSGGSGSPGGGSGSSGGGSGSGLGPGTGGGGTASGAPGSTASGTLTGDLVRTRFGDVQVQITLKNGKITDVLALQLPTHGRSGSISQAVEPMLHDEALQAQNARIDIVSGATYTSEAYAESLQSALDQAHS